MALVIPPNYYEMTFHHTLQGGTRPAVCTLGFHYTGSNFNTDVGFVALAWAQNQMGSMTTNWRYVKFQARNDIGTVSDLAQDVPGSTAHPETSPNVAFLIHKVTNQPGRFSKGRMYFPGVSEQDIDAVGTVVGSKVTELRNNFINFQAACDLHQFAPVILHNSPTHQPTVVTTFSIDPLVATQRRRLRR